MIEATSPPENESTDQSEFLPHTRIAQILKVAPRTVANLYEQGKLKGVRISNTSVIHIDRQHFESVLPDLLNGNDQE